ncbi:MAG TPA: RNA polymerase sigma factor [Actinomycetes bacterium]|jgi:RNA polymerase sigma-70 factor (ECF subfamily)
MSEGWFETTLARAQGGDEHAFGALYRLVQPGLLRYLNGIAIGAAEDVAADSWLEVVRALHGFTGDQPHFVAWVFTIARRKAIDRGRYEARRLTAPLDETDSYGLLEPDVADLAERGDATAQAIALVRSLPPNQAEVVLLRVVAGLEIDQVAQMLGKSNGAVRVLTHRGLRRLGAALEPRPVREEV